MTDQAATGFCPQCGAARVAGARFCGTCGQDFQPGAVDQAATTPKPGAATEQLAGIAWIVSAALIGYLGLQQLGYVGTIFDRGNLQELGVWNLISAGITIYFGARLLVRASHGSLSWSVVWAILTVAWNGYQITQGATHWAYAGATVGALVAGVLSIVALQSAPSVIAPAPGIVATAPDPSAVQRSPDEPRRGLPVAELLVVVAIVAAAAVGVALLANRSPSSSAASTVATEPPGPTPISTPPFAWLPAGFNATSEPTVAYRWLDNVTCKLSSCWGIEAIAHLGCPNSLYVELSILDDSGAAVGTTNDVVSALAPDQHAKLTFENTEKKGHQAKIANVSCY